MNLNSAAEELRKALMDSQEYINLTRTKKEAMRNPKIASLLEAFEKKQETLNESVNLRPDQIQAIMDEINSDYEKLESVPEIKKYFNSMEAFNQLFGNVIGRIQASLRDSMRN